MPKPYWFRNEDMITLEDGFKYLDTEKGAIGATGLREIADYLDELNGPHAIQLARDLEALCGEHGRRVAVEEEG